MKQIVHIFTFLFFCLSQVFLFAQSPDGFNYQAVARDNAGELLNKKSITVKAIILSGKSASNKVYQETHIVTTGVLGHFSLVIGKVLHRITLLTFHGLKTLIT